MSISIKPHKDKTTQSDYENGAIDIRSVDPAECFTLGELRGGLISAGFEVVSGSYGQGIFLRVPLVKRKV